MLNGDLYPKGKKLFHVGLAVDVEYIGHAGNGIHIVLAPPLDYLDDRVREVKAEELLDEAVPVEVDSETRRVDDECLAWIRRNQVSLYMKYCKTIGGLEAQRYLPEDLDVDRGFLFFAVFCYEARCLKSQMVPGTKTRQ
jgi:hypothetical protein